MGPIRQHAVFIGLTGSVGAAMAYLGPDHAVSIGSAFAALLLLHLHAVGSVRRASASSDEAAAAERGAHRPKAAPDGEGREAREARPSAASGESRPTAGLVPDPGHPPRQQNGHGGAEHAAGADGEPGDAQAAAPDGERSAEEDVWLRQQLTGDVDDIAFLPPYASTEAEPPPEAPKRPRVDWREFVEAEDGLAAAEASPERTDTSRNVPIPRHFALGTVAIIRGVLSPAEVARVLLEQRRQPRKQFGEVAVEMGALSPAQLKDLLLAQREGLFTDEEIQEARQKLREFRDRESEQEG